MKKKIISVSIRTSARGKRYYDNPITNKRVYVPNDMRSRVKLDKNGRAIRQWLGRKKRKKGRKK